jgi:hypothetical protein
VIVARRRLIRLVATLPLWPLVGCAKPPQTPLAHLYGQEWVHGAYAMYAQRYLDVQSSAEQSSNDAYRVLAQKGVTALDALQSREVPFLLKVDPQTSAFQIEREVPERLMFSSNMNDADRRAATEAWKRAREHIHSDYEEIHRLNWALTTLLGQLNRIRSAIDEAHLEQYKLTRQLDELNGGGEAPFQLPYQVSRADYQNVLFLLLIRLDNDRSRLDGIEKDIVAVGLTVRATDAGSGSLAANIHKVLLAVVTDADASPPSPAEFPKEDEPRAKMLASAKELAQKIGASAEYKTWKKKEETKTWEAFGSVLPLIDAFTHIPVSAIYRQVLSLWRGDGDYLAHLKTLAALVPGGGQVSKTIIEAIETTEKVRRVATTVQGVMKDGVSADGAAQALLQRGEQLTDSALARAQGAAFAQAGGLVNTATEFGRSRLDKQLAFFTKKEEVVDVQSLLARTPLMAQALPSIPAIPAMTE